MNFYISIFKLIRIYNLFIGIFSVWVASYLLDISINFLVIKCMLVVSITMALGYITNDLLDIKSDIINHPRRPLVNNQIKYLDIMFVFIVLFIILFYILFQLEIKAICFFLIYILPSLLLYNIYFKRILIVGNMVVSILLGCVFLFTEVVLLQTYNQLLIPFILTVCFSFLREMIKDMEDYNGDKLRNFKTLPLFLGLSQARYVIIFWIVCLAVILMFSFYWFNSNLNYLLLIIIFIEIPLFYMLFLIVKFPSKSTYRSLSKMLKTLCYIGLLILMVTK